MNRPYVPELRDIPLTFRDCGDNEPLFTCDLCNHNWGCLPPSFLCETIRGMEKCPMGFKL